MFFSDKKFDFALKLDNAKKWVKLKFYFFYKNGNKLVDSKRNNCTSSLAISDDKPMI